MTTLHIAKTCFTLVATVHLLLLHDNHILLLRRANTGYEDGNYSVIAGHLDGNEQIKEAMQREACEEAGITLSLDALEVVSVMHRKTAQDERMDFFLVASQWAGNIVNNEPHKCDELAWYRLDALPDNVIPYIRRAIESYERGIRFDNFGWQ